MIVGPLLFVAVLAAPPAALPGDEALADPADFGPRLEEILANLTLEQKVGQLLMVGFGGREVGSEIRHLLRSLHVGGVLLFDRNVGSNRQLTKLIRDLREAMEQEVQPFVAIDQEGGNVVRVNADVVVVPGAMTIGATRDPVLAFLAGQANAIDLKLLGIDMNLAPVLDVNRNADNPVINVRAFGDRAEPVANLGVPFIQGQQQGGMATVAKHFPGHGTTTSDSHFSLPSIDLSAEALRGTELLPFRRAIAAGLDAVMMAHVQVPALDPEGNPASLSSRVITDLLRGELGFRGVVITDDLEMHAIADRIGVGKAAVQGILAGADVVMVLWTPHKKQEAYDALLQAARDGTIPQERLDASVRRVLSLKAKRGTLDALARPPENLAALLPNPLHQRLATAVASRGLTLVRNERSLIPLCDGHKLVVASPYGTFLETMRQLLPGTRVLALPRVPSRPQREKDLEKLTELAEGAQAVIIGVGNAYQAWLVQELSHRTSTPLVVVSFGSPYLLRHFPGVAGYLCTYSYQPSVQRAAALALAGQRSITGKLPVALSPRYPWGFGLTTNAGGCATAASAR